jgi:hypothetical protein
MAERRLRLARARNRALRHRSARAAARLALALMLCACYAQPERHATAPAGEQDAGEDPVSVPDAEADARPPERDAGGHDAGGHDAAQDEDSGSPCHCDDPNRPVCIETTGLCVACTMDNRGACSESQLCDFTRGECVECLQHSDCKDPAASVCDAQRRCTPCAHDAACAHLDDKQVCLSGACVQCTQEKRAACLVHESPTKTVQHACHALEHTCTDREVGKTQACGECLSDAECAAGHACVTMDLAGAAIEGNWFCLPLMTEINCDRRRPYIGVAPGKTTIEGATQDVCTLRVSTCAAHADYSNKFCGLDQGDQPIPLDGGVPVAPSVKGDTELCGLSGLADGYCVEARPGSHRCTVPCASDVQDCPQDAPACTSVPHATGTRYLCTIP